MPAELRHRQDPHAALPDSDDRPHPPPPPPPFDAEPQVPDPARGPGQLVVAPAGYTAEVGAVDEQAETVAFGWRKASDASVGNIRCLARQLLDGRPEGVLEQDLTVVGELARR